ncbi:MAG TPA: P1 family peptidase [Vicinamibacteria bacterium]|nr:P1 family peptidase [Vicinamibacteria bacterium]
MAPFALPLAALIAPALLHAAEERPRARDLGLRLGTLPSGPHDAITDVPGVHVGQVTLIEGDRVRTGVTAIVPHPGNVFQDKVAGAVFVGNAFGKLAGSTQVEELGTIETPIVLTNTLSVGAAIQGVVSWTLAQPGNEEVRSVNALVGETNDGGLNDIRGLHVTPAHVVEAIRAARTGPVAEGSVGAGTGTIAFGWKGGIGTSSRVVTAGGNPHTVGVLVQSNYGGDLVMAGVPVGRALAGDRRSAGAGRDSADGSCMIVVATDAPLESRDLRRLAARAVFALARTGSSYSHGSGDYAIAFSTSPEARYRFGETLARPRSFLPGDAVSPLFEAVLEATEEAVINSLLRATTVTGNGRTVEAIPLDRLREVLGHRGH